MAHLAARAVRISCTSPPRLANPLFNAVLSSTRLSFNISKALGSPLQRVIIINSTIIDISKALLPEEEHRATKLLEIVRKHCPVSVGMAMTGRHCSTPQTSACSSSEAWWPCCLGDPYSHNVKRMTVTQIAVLTTTRNTNHAASHFGGIVLASETP